MSVSRKERHLNLGLLVPMYEEGNDIDELCSVADYHGMAALTEDEQYYVDSYGRLDKYFDSLAAGDYNELVQAAEDKNEEIMKRHTDAEFAMYIDNLKVAYPDAYKEYLESQQKPSKADERAAQAESIVSFEDDMDDVLERN